MVPSDWTAEAGRRETGAAVSAGKWRRVLVVSMDRIPIVKVFEYYICYHNNDGPDSKMAIKMIGREHRKPIKSLVHIPCLIHILLHIHTINRNLLDSAVNGPTHQAQQPWEGRGGGKCARGRTGECVE